MNMSAYTRRQRYFARLDVQRARLLADSLCGRCALSADAWYAMFTRWNG